MIIYIPQRFTWICFRWLEQNIFPRHGGSMLSENVFQLKLFLTSNHVVRDLIKQTRYNKSYAPVGITEEQYTIYYPPNKTNIFPL